jgi:hypothetical protein
MVESTSPIPQPRTMGSVASALLADRPVNVGDLERCSRCSAVIVPRTRGLDDQPSPRIWKPHDCPTHTWARLKHPEAPVPSRVLVRRDGQRGPAGTAEHVSAPLPC